MMTTTIARKPAPGVLLRRLSGPLNALLASRAATVADDGAFELHATAEELRDGGMVSVSMRVALHCPACAPVTELACLRCGGKRTIEELYSAWLAIPPGADDGAALVPSAVLEGMVRPVRFRVRRSGR